MKKKLVYGLIALFMLSFVLAGCDNGTTTETVYIGDNIVPGIRITDAAGLKNALALDPYGAAVNPNEYALYSTANTNNLLGIEPAPKAGEIYTPDKLINQTDFIPKGVILNLGGGAFTVNGGDITVGGELNIYKGAQLIVSQGTSKLIIGEHPEFLRADNDPLFTRRDNPTDLSLPLKYINKAQGVVRVFEGGVLDFDELGKGGTGSDGLNRAAILFAPNVDIAVAGAANPSEQTYKQALEDVTGRFIPDEAVALVAQANSGEFINGGGNGRILAKASTEAKLLMEGGRLGGILVINDDPSASVMYPSVKVIGGSVNVLHTTDYIALANAPFATNLYVKINSGSQSTSLGSMTIRKDTLVTDISGLYSHNLVVEGYLKVEPDAVVNQVADVENLTVAKGGYFILAGTAEVTAGIPENVHKFEKLNGALTIDGHLDAGTADAFPYITELTVRGANTLVANSNVTFQNLKTLNVDGRFIAGTISADDSILTGPSFPVLNSFTLSSGIFKAPRINSGNNLTTVALNSGVLDLTGNPNPPPAIKAALSKEASKTKSFGVAPSTSEPIVIATGASVDLPGGNFKPEKEITINGALNVGAGTAAGTILVDLPNQNLTVNNGGALNISGSSSMVIGSSATVTIGPGSSLNLTSGAIGEVGGSGAILTINEDKSGSGAAQLVLSPGSSLKIAGTGSGLVIGEGATVKVGGLLSIDSTAGSASSDEIDYKSRNKGTMIFDSTSVVDMTGMAEGGGTVWLFAGTSAKVVYNAGLVWMRTSIQSEGTDGKYVSMAPQNYTVPSGFSPLISIVLRSGSITETAGLVPNMAYDTKYSINGNVLINGLKLNNTTYNQFSTYTQNSTNYAAIYNADVGTGSVIEIGANTFLGIGDMNKGTGSINVGAGAEIIGNEGSLIGGGIGNSVTIGSSSITIAPDSKMAVYYSNGGSYSGIVYVKNGANTNDGYLKWSATAGGSAGTPGWIYYP